MHSTHHPLSAARDESPIADTLRLAALYLMRHGWVQHDYFARHPEPNDPFPPADLLGALVMVITGQKMLPCEITEACGGDTYRQFTDTLTYLAWWLGLRDTGNGEHLHVLQDWNDRPGRLPGDVIDELMAAAAHTRGQTYRPGDYLTADITPANNTLVGAR